MSFKAERQENGQAVQRKRAWQLITRNFRPAARQTQPVGIIQRAQRNPRLLTRQDVLHLESTIGNRGVGRLLTQPRQNVSHGSAKPDQFNALAHTLVQGLQPAPAREQCHVAQQSGGLGDSRPVRRMVQRTIGDGHDLSAPWLAGDPVLEAIYDDERLMRNGSRGTAVKKVQQLLFYLGIDFPAHGADGKFGGETETAVKEFQRANVDEAGTRLVDDGIVGPLTMGALNREANRTGTNIGNLIRTAPLPALQGPPTASPTPISVDRIDVVDSGAGAIGGYPAIVGGASLNTPGPFSDPVTGETKNSHQIHFHLDNGNSASLTPRRELQRTAIVRGTSLENPPTQVLPPGVAGPPVPGGFTGLRVGPDGPPPHEIQRPTADTIVIADAPGINRAPAAADYPISYRSHFFLTVEDARGAPIARIKYDVHILRTSLANIPNAENRIVATEKKDFVRGRNL